MITIRKVISGDAELIYKWRNEPYIVNLGSLKKTVTWNEHLNWFNETLKETNRVAYIIEIDGIAAGQVRFDKEEDNTCYISVYLLQDFTGKGKGIDAIKMGCKRIFSDWPQMKKVIAIVRDENESGQKAFLKSGFVSDSVVCEVGHKTYILLKENGSAQ